MKRADLLAAISRVEAALAPEKYPLPPRVCLCFTGSHVFAFDDKVALVSPLKTDTFKGAVRGRVFSAWFAETTGKDVETLEAKDGVLRIKCGKAAGEFPVLPETDFDFAVPDVSKAAKVELDADALRLLKLVVELSLGEDEEHKWSFGVQAEFTTTKTATFYTSANVGASRAYTGELKTMDKRLGGKSVLLPPRFVRLLVERTKDKVALFVHDEWLAAELGDGTMMYQRLPEATDFQTFRDLFSDAAALRAKALEIPKYVWGALKRANVLLAGEKMPLASFRVTEGRLVIETTSKFGRDSTPMKLSGAHPDFLGQVVPELPLRASQVAETFVVTWSPKSGKDKDATKAPIGEKLALFGKNFEYYVSLNS